MTLAPDTWFNNAERCSLLLQAAKLWERTPFFPNSCAPGPDGGVDCVHLANAVFSLCACIPRQAIPPQFMDAGQHTDRSPLLEAFETWPDLVARFRRLPDCSPANILPGDALCFRAGRVPHHCGVMLPGADVLHVRAPEGVQRTPLRAVIRGRRILGLLEAVFRPLP